MKLGLAAGAAYLFTGIAGLLAAGQAEAGLDRSLFAAIEAHSWRETPPMLEGESFDPKCVKAFDTVMESCDGRDIGIEDDQADDGGDYAGADQDDGDYADGAQYEDGFEIVAYSL